MNDNHLLAWFDRLVVAAEEATTALPVFTAGIAVPPPTTPIRR